MAKTISIDNLSKEIMSELSKYGLSVATGVKKSTDETTKKFVEDTRADAPRGYRNQYYRNITSRVKIETPNMKINEWYVRAPEYRLTHLLIDGHRIANAKSGKSRTEAQDFITPNMDKAEKTLETSIEGVIRNGH